jgi:hypothetical protein
VVEDLTKQDRLLVEVVMLLLVLVVVVELLVIMDLPVGVEVMAVMEFVL